MKIFLFLLFALVGQASAAPVFRAGVSAIDISPKTFPRIIAGGFLEGRGDRLADKLHVRSFVLDDGKTKIAFAIVDTCMMEQPLIDEAKQLASKQCGIPVARMMVSATHTHSAPAAMGCLGTRKDTGYAKFLIPKIAEGIVAADKALQPARIGWSSVDDWQHTHNRRWIRLEGKEVADPFGQPTGRANMHPGYLSKDVVGPSGPVDPQLSVISLQTLEGKPLGVLANYSQHYFGNGAVSSDYYGLFCKHLAEKMGQQGDGNGPFVCAMSQGTSGDQMWMDYGAEKKSITIDQYAAEVADSAMQALKKVTYLDHAPLGMVESTLELSYRVPDKERLAWAKPISARIENDLPKNKEEVYAREALILHERQKTSLKLQAIRIGELGIATLPNEVYAITGLRLRWSSPFGTHFNIELANGAEGYIPPAEQHELGGYTTWPARTAGLEIGAEGKIRQTLGEMLHKLDSAPGRGMAHDASPYAMEISGPQLALCIDFQDGIKDRQAFRTGAKTTVHGGHAFWLPGIGAGKGYGDESALKTEVLVPRDKINRSIHLAGGHLETTGLDLSANASIGLWFWLGHESGASNRTGTLLEAFGAVLNARQFTDHTVQLEWASQTGHVPKAAAPAAFADDWHFVVLIREGGQLRVHLDGGEEPVLRGKAGEGSSKLVYGKNLQGKLDEIVIWDRVIEPSSIAKLWNASKVADDNARHASARKERAGRAQAQTSALLQQHENWAASLRFRSTKANDVSAVTAYLISRGAKADHQAPGDHLGIGGNYKDSLPGRLFVFNGNAANQIVRGKTIIGPGTWNTAQLERIGSRVKVTLNGQVEIDAELPVTAPGAKDLFFGRRCDDFAPLEGEFSDVAVVGLEKPAAAAPAAKIELASRPLSPEESAKKWHVREGYRVELVAAEPVVLDPVAFDWDEQGRLWVVEMADYPLGMDGKGKAGGRVVMLEDTEHDGRYDKRTVIAKDLNFPTGILTWRGGAIVTAAPDIVLLQPNGDQKVLFTGFSTGNQQLRVNGLRWGMDGWVYCAAGAHNGGYNKGTQIESKLTGEKIDLGSRDFRFKPDTGEFDPQSGPSQFGRARDDWGNWFGVQNSFPLWHYVLQDHYLRRNPHVIPPDPIHQLFPRNPPVYPASSLEKRFHSFDQSGRFTSACGIEIYRSDALFNDGKTHAFTCEPFHNVVQHHVLEADGVTFKAVRDPAEAKVDFLASEDRWCRPVMVRTGPDGALWVADMYRYMIEHPQWLPQNGKDELLPHYREGDDKGRIWRVVREGAPGRSVASMPQTASFGSANGSVRDRAQMRYLWNKAAASAWTEPAEVMTSSKHPAAQAQAAWTLHQAGQLPSEALKLLLLHQDDAVVIQALQIAETMPWKANEEALLFVVNGKRFSRPRVRMQLVLSAGQWQGDWPADIIGSVIHEAEVNSPLSGAAFSSCLPHLTRICGQLSEYEAPLTPGVIAALLRSAMGDRNEQAVAALIKGANDEAKIAEVLTVLDEKELSLAEFAKQVKSAEAQQGLRKLTETLAKTAESVRASNEPPSMEKLALLASDREYRNMVKAMLPGLWKNTPSTEVLRLATRLQPQEGPDFLTGDWDARTPATRAQIVEALLSSDAWTLALLEKIKAKQIDANACDAATRARLMKHPKKEVQKLAAAVLTDSASATRAAVVEKLKPALKLTGDAAKGKTMFAQVCISCHKLDGIGLDLGPDLRSVAQHDAEKLLNSILDPSAIIEPGFTAYHCTLKNGEQLYGVVATETSASLTLKMAGNVTRSVLRSDVTSLKSTGTSLMPEGLEAALTPQSLADLIAYLKQAR
ncbi:MAG: neutral/alkaline non-lysosomal ceramidase N-terminal domain-containing protein [Prosthecobacter sp.]